MKPDRGGGEHVEKMEKAGAEHAYVLISKKKRERKKRFRLGHRRQRRHSLLKTIRQSTGGCSSSGRWSYQLMPR